MLRIFKSDDKEDTLLYQSKSKNVLSKSKEIANTVSKILFEVRSEGNSKLLEYTSKFDRVDFTSETMKVSSAEIAAAKSKCKKEAIEALQFAASRIKKYHERQKPKDEIFTDEEGFTLGWRWISVDSAGLYVPGGKASYPSSVLMNAIPAKIAGVGRLVMCVPAPDGVLNPLVLAAAEIAGVDEIYKVGGAQAIAAMAYGTETIAPVDVIVGPGNVYVAEAKRQVFGHVGIDMIAGPSEILVIADETANPRWIAADLLSQAEHDANARCILLTTSEKLAAEVNENIKDLIKKLPKEVTASESIEKNGIAIVCNSIEEACEIANKIAPEHLELVIKDAERYLPSIKHAGAVFVGNYTCESLGDYVAGPSHVLPTSGSARFSSALGVFDFMKRSSVIIASKKAFDLAAEHTAVLAEEEGLRAHAEAIYVRQNQ